MVQESDSPVDLVLRAVSNPIRRTAITHLRETEMRFSQLLAACGLNYDHDAGHFAYHLSELIKRRIVEKRGDLYTLTGFGSKVAEMLGFLEAEGSYLFEEKHTGGWKGMDNLELEVEWIDSEREVRLDRKTGERDLSIGFNTGTPALRKRVEEKMPDGPEKERLLDFLEQTDNWRGPQRVLTKNKDTPLGWATVGSEISWGDRPSKKSDRPKVSVNTALRIEHLAILAISPWSDAKRKRVASGLIEAVLDKAKEIGADTIKVDGTNADDTALIEALKELGFRRITTNYAMQKTLA